MGIENLEPYDMILDDSLLVTTITYSWDRVVIEGFYARGRTREQILRDEGLWRERWDDED